MKTLKKQPIVNKYAQKEAKMWRINCKNHFESKIDYDKILLLGVRAYVKKEKR